MHILCETVFRGIKMDNPQLLQGESSLPDFRLVPKHLEKNYTFTKTASKRIEENVLPRYMNCPPLLKEILLKNGIQDPKLKTIRRETTNSLYRVAEEGEQPTREFEGDFVTTKCPKLYKGINYDI